MSIPVQLLTQPSNQTWPWKILGNPEDPLTKPPPSLYEKKAPSHVDGTGGGNGDYKSTNITEESTTVYGD